MLRVPAAVAEPTAACFLQFAGTDIWRNGAFAYGGLLWAQSGLDAEGIILKLIFSGGRYDYPSGTLQTNLGGTLISAAALPGWHFARDGFDVRLYASPVVQDYRSTPYDPGSRLHGGYVGGQFVADVWYEPTTATTVALNGSVLSIGPTGGCARPWAGGCSSRSMSVPRRRASGVPTSSSRGSARISPAGAFTRSNGRLRAALSWTRFAATGCTSASASARATSLQPFSSQAQARTTQSWPPY